MLALAGGAERLWGHRMGHGPSGAENASYGPLRPGNRYLPWGQPTP